MQAIKDVTILGDVHLGKKFVTGVPIHRLGDREKMVWEDFKKSILECDTKYHVQCGDLFDSFTVSNTLVLEVAEQYEVAASFNEDTTYFILRGNHDASREASKKSSFDVLKKLLKETPNVVFVDNEIRMGLVEDSLAFLPWHPFKSSSELADELVEFHNGWGNGKLRAVFCHCDIETFGTQSDFNLIPTKILSQITDHIITGHIHLPQETKIDNVFVTVTGSMQPYSHSEDKEGKYYVTCTRDEVPEDCTNLNVRILLSPDDNDPLPDLDCLSLVTKRQVEGEKEAIEVNFDAFDMTSLFKASLEENNVSQTVTDKVQAKLKELRNV